MSTLIERLHKVAAHRREQFPGIVQADWIDEAADALVALEAEVAHFQAEYQDEVGQTELIANVETLKTEVATLKRKLDDAAQLIKMRTADCADLRSEAQTARELMYGVVAERDRLKTALADLAETEAAYRLAHDTMGDGHIDAGRAWDKMRKAGDHARSTLASNPSTEEGG